MKREIISKAISGIDMEHLVACETYAPKLNRKVIARKIVVLVNCLLLALFVIGYATGFWGTDLS